MRPLLLLIVRVGALQAQNTPYPFLASGYTQEVFATLRTSGSFGGVAFASNGDVWVKNCNTQEGPFRFALDKTVAVNGMNVHPQVTVLPSVTNFGCGMVIHPDGRLYLNTPGGAQRVDANTGVVLATIGPGGNSYGITVDPQTNRLVYPAAPCANTTSCTLVSVETTNGNVQNLATFVAPAVLEDVDGVTFDPTGNYIVVAGRTGTFPNDTPYLFLLTRQGGLIRQLPASHFPDGANFHQNPFYLVTNNNDGTISRFDFPTDDVRQIPVETVIASGGFRGDLSGVGADGCFYASQQGTRYTNGSVTTLENSVVRMCSTAGKFVPPPGSGPVISLVANAFGDTPLIAPNTWVEVKGSGLAHSGTSRIWKDADFANAKMPVQLDDVSATTNGKPAYVYFISPTQVNILTPPDAMSGSVQVQLTVGGVVSNIATVQAQPKSLSIFEFVSSSGLHYLYGRHSSDNSLIGPPSLFPGLTTPVKQGESIYIAGNGFGPTDTPVISGALTQSGTLPTPLPIVKIGGIQAEISFAGLAGIGTYQINLVVPINVPDGDLPVVVTYDGSSTQANLLLTVQH